jgi:hypothetical protein
MICWPSVRLFGRLSIQFLLAPTPQKNAKRNGAACGIKTQNTTPRATFPNNPAMMSMTYRVRLKARYADALPIYLLPTVDTITRLTNHATGVILALRPEDPAAGRFCGVAGRCNGFAQHDRQSWAVVVGPGLRRDDEGEGVH